MSYEIMGRFVPPPPPLRIKPGEILFLHFDEMKITDRRNQDKEEAAPPAESDQILIRFLYGLRRWLTIPVAFGLVEGGFWLLVHVCNPDVTEETKIFLGANFLLLMGLGFALIGRFFDKKWFLDYDNIRRRPRHNP